MFLFDTCSLLWYTVDPDKLSPAARKYCDKIYSNSASVSSMSLWEIGLKIKNNKLDIGTTIEDFSQRIKALNTIEILPVDEHIWIESLSLQWDHRDPADRVIVATAKLNKLPLLSSDTKIRDFYNNTIW